MQYLRYNTDSQEVVFGIFVNSTDGNTEETGLTIANTDIKIWKAGATTLANKNTGGATHISNGIYYAVFDATDTNTLGSGKAFIHVSGALYQVLEFCVLPQKVYDSMIAGSDNLEVDTIQIEGADATNQLNAATPAVTVSDKTGFSLSSSQSFNLTGNITGNLSGSVGSVTGGVTVTTNNDKTGYSLSASGVTAVQTGLSTLTAQQVWEYATRTLSSFGSLVSDITTAVWGAATRTLSAFGFNVTASSVTDKTGYSLSVTPPTAAEIRTEIDTNSTQIAAVKTVTDDLAGMLQTSGSLKQFTTNALENAPSGGGGGDATAANQTIIIGHLTDVKGVTFSSSTDSLEAIRDRGDAAWTTGGGASGSNAITITVTDTDVLNIIDAAVEIWDSAGTSFIERKSSNSSGQAVFNLDDGTYTVKIHKSGYSIANQILIVSGTASVTYEMTAFIIGTPASASLCRVYDYFHELDDGTISRLTGNATIQTPYQDSNGYYYSVESGVYNSTTKVLYFDLVIGSSVIIDIPDMGVSKTITVPNSATARLKDL